MTTQDVGRNGIDTKAPHEYQHGQGLQFNIGCGHSLERIIDKAEQMSEIYFRVNMADDSTYVISERDIRAYSERMVDLFKEDLEKIWDEVYAYCTPEDKKAISFEGFTLAKKVARLIQRRLEEIHTHRRTGDFGS